MRGVAAALELKSLGIRKRRADSVELFERPVFVVATLDQERGRADRRQQRLDRPVAKARVEPDVVPTPEDVVGIAMIASEQLAQARRRVELLRALNALDRNVFDKDMRRFEN